MIYLRYEGPCRKFLKKPEKKNNNNKKQEKTNKQTKNRLYSIIPI